MKGLGIRMRIWSDGDDDDWWAVSWDCPVVMGCGFQRTFEGDGAEVAAHSFAARLRREGCPDSPWFPNEDGYAGWFRVA